MSQLSTTELLAIITAPKGDYTDGAVAIARAEVEGRPESPESTAGSGTEAAHVSSLSSNLGSLGAFVLIWIGWNFVVFGIRLLLRPRPGTMLIGVCAGAFGAGIFWLARRISPSWRRLIVVVPILLGGFAIFRGAIGSDPEHMTNGVMLVVGGVLAHAILRILQRDAPATAAGIQ
jgi:hypothetical protein